MADVEQPVVAVEPAIQRFVSCVAGRSAQPEFIERGGDVVISTWNSSEGSYGISLSAVATDHAEILSGEARELPLPPGSRSRWRSAGCGGRGDDPFVQPDRATTTIKYADGGPRVGDSPHFRELCPCVTIVRPVSSRGVPRCIKQGQHDVCEGRLGSLLKQRNGLNGDSTSGEWAS